MNQNHEIDTDLPAPLLPSPLAEAVLAIAEAPLDEPAIERVRLAARQIASVQVMQPTRPHAGMPQAVRQHGAKARLSRAAIGLATAVLVGFGAWQLLGPPTVESTLYAQVRAATKKVSTIHAVWKFTGPDGTVSDAVEFWSARGVGFACVTSECTRIDDGKFVWEYIKGSKFGSRSQSQGPDLMLELALDVKGELDRHCRRFPEGDREIDKIPCRCHQAVAPQAPAGANQANRGPEQQTFAYVSEDFLIRRLETHEMTGGKWQVRAVRTWEYDVAVPPETFRPAFGADVEIVDADEAFNRLVDLPTALYVTERSGLIFAVHRAEQLENGGVALMTSVRGTAETLRKFPLQRRMIEPGLYFVVGPATNWNADSLQGGCSWITLASADHQGINVEWWIMVPRGQPAGALEVEPGKIKATFTVTPGGTYADHYKDANGVTHHITWNETIAVPRQEPPASLTAIAEHLYADQKLLRAVKFKRLVDVRDVTGVPNSTFGTVDDTQPAEFAAAVAEHLKYWEREDIDFQIKYGCPGGADPPAMMAIPGARLGYYSLVDDDTLKRFAVCPHIRIISLRHTRITSAGLAHLKSLENLEDLDLAETGVDDDGLAHLQELKSLRRLNVTETRVTNAGIEKLKAAIPGLDVIDGNGSEVTR